MFDKICGIKGCGERICVALSGGSDSMALLHYLYTNADKLNIKVSAVNVEHGIRGDSSKKDSLFVKDYCEKFSIPLFTFTVDSVAYQKEHKVSLEESARILRYGCFKSLIEKDECDYVATAHHGKDNAETVLFNLFRGCGIKGIKGIGRLENIIRPFLYVDKKEIEEYVNKNSIPYVVDETNLSTDYTRNYIRLKILPEIEKVFPDAEESINRLSQIAKSEDEFLDSLAKKQIVVDKDVYKISVNTDSVLFARATILVFKSLGIEKDWTKSHVDACLALLSNQTGATAHLPKGILAVKEYDYIVFYKNTKEDSKNCVQFGLGELTIANKSVKIIALSFLPQDLKNGLYIDADKVPENAVLRTMQKGDVFKKFGGGTKSLADYFTDLKIAKRVRPCIPLLASGNKILAIMGIGISEDVKIDGNTKRIYQLQ